MSKELMALVHDYSELEVLELIQARSGSTRQSDVDIQNLLAVGLVLSLVIMFIGAI